MKKLLFGFLLFFISFAQLWAGDSCSVGLTKALTSSSNTYTVNASTDQNGQKYYFTTDGPGVVVVSVTTANNHFLNFSKTACPTNSGGSSRQIFAIDSSDTDFNLMVYRGTNGVANYTLNVVFFPSNGNGLIGEYYNDSSYSATTWNGTLALVRTDANIDFDWGNGSPSTGVNSDLFSVIWSGYLYIPETANYTFYAAFDDYMDVTIDGVQKYSHDGWTGGASVYNNFSGGNLAKGYHPIQIRFKEAWGGTYAKLAFSNDANILTQTTIPQQLLFTTIRTPGYCETHGLSTGFHLIDPDGVKTHTFEIFCDDSTPKRDLVALPIKNGYNNFLFNSTALSSNLYYTQAQNNSTQFQAIEINANTMDVVVPPTSAPTDKGTYKIMGKGFSNINLIGTPFAIDWSSTSLSNCTTSKLRKGYYGQAVKINTLDYDNQAICSIDGMKLKLLSDYQYVEYRNSEVLGKTCKEMAEAIPTDLLAGSDIKGHFFISPLQHDRSYSSTDITQAYARPLVAFCWYQTDLQYAWTFLLALDGAPTHTKSDLVNKVDSCSKSGLWPFVANSEDAFERVRQFLSDKKSEWGGYTGTMNEKMNIFGGGDYYLEQERSSLIWPYGSFGIYFPYNGNHDKNGNSKTWKGADNKTPGWMSGSPMHNIQTINSDYARHTEASDRNYYSWGSPYSSTDTTSDNLYSYSDTMGYKGWVSILGAKDLNKTDKWFVSRTGAGKNISTKNYTNPYYEPNGNYDAGAWLNFLFDSDGHVRHDDDMNSFYYYYDYMCMAEDNYDFTDRYGLILQGPFRVVDKKVGAGSELSNLKSTGLPPLYTKITQNVMDVDLVILNDAMNATQSNRDISAGVFLKDVTQDANGNDQTNDIKFMGAIGLGSYYYDTTGKYRMPLNKSGNLRWDKTDKRMFFEFRFCKQTNMKWTDCWTQSGNTATCQTGKDDLCLVGDSDDFAVRPANFVVTEPKTVFTAGATDNKLSINAKDFLGSDASGYNQNSVNLTAEVSENKWYQIDSNTSKVGTPVVTGPVAFKSGVFKDGVSTDSALDFVDVGRFKVNVKDSNWAAIDKDAGDCLVGSGTNTQDTTGKIGCDTNNTDPQYVRFKPDYFLVANVGFSDFNNGFTYIGADEAHSAYIDGDITAQNKQNEVTKNYSNGWYARNIVATRVLKKTFPLGVSGFFVASAPTLSFTNGVSSLRNNNLRLNFDKNISAASDPINTVSSAPTPTSDSISDIDIDITDTDGVTGVAHGGNKTTGVIKDSTAHFLYGKVRMPDAMVDYSAGGMTVRAYAEVYASSPANLPSGTTWTLSPGSSSWYVNSLDSASSISSIYVRDNEKLTSLANSDGYGTTSATSAVSGGSASIGITVANNVNQKIKAHLAVDSWLWYSLNGTAYSYAAGSDCTQHPCGSIEVFGGNPNWFGSGDNVGNNTVSTIPVGRRKSRSNW